MINELYSLSEALDKGGVQVQKWHGKYNEIPQIEKNAPCVRILISEGKVVELSSVKEELGEVLRKFGTNQGTYPIMSLAPLYRITDEAVKKELSALRPEDLDSSKIEEIRSWCQEDNWGRKFRDKYRISMKNMPDEMLALIPGFEPLQILIKESNFFLDPAVLHQELEKKAFELLTRGEEISLALSILFYQGKSKEKAADDYGKLSVAFETPQLIAKEIPAISEKFVSELNEALLSAVLSIEKSLEPDGVDAFGIPFRPTEDPMPTVKIGGKRPVSLRTMFKEQRCQRRYGKIGNESYPISSEMQRTLQAALSWLSRAEREGITWIYIDKDEMLFVYPERLSETSVSYTKMFKQPAKRDTAFSQAAKQFIDELQRGKKSGTDSNADWIQLFILQRCDASSTRAKIIYSRQTDSHELEMRSEEWTSGCSNLPLFPFGQARIPFPLDTADILNYFWKQNGEMAADKFKPVPKYRGMELLMEPDLPTDSEFHNLSQQAMTIGAFFGTQSASKKGDSQIRNKIENMLALIGLLLYRKGIRKDYYMESLPYLYGQLLKISDELHVLYCKVVRTGPLPAQLAGSSLYRATAESPVRALCMLGERMRPYITWAKTYRAKGEVEKGKESWRAGWLLSQYEDTATKLYAKWTPETRFNDEEKALLFIGYLAAFPRREKNDNPSEFNSQNEEVENHE